MSDLFKDIIPAILKTKKDVLDNEKDYNAYVVNRALSYHVDCILFANEMNRLPNIDPKLQFHYHLNSVRSQKRRFQAWVKNENPANLELVQQYFGFSKAKAREALSILTDAQIDEIRINSDIGGVSNVDSRRYGRGNPKRAR